MVDIKDPKVLTLLNGRSIATLATENEDGLIHLTAVWYLFENGAFYIASSSRSRKVRNLQARPQASLMVDVRRPGAERGLAAAGKADLIFNPAEGPAEQGGLSRELNRRIHRRYLSEAALADSRVGPTMAGLDDVTIRITPTRWHAWDMADLDDAVLGGAMKTPGYLLPLD